MKIRKKLWRAVKPLLLIGAGLMAGIVLVASNSSSVEIHHDFGDAHVMFDEELELELERMEVELERMMVEMEIPAIPAIPEIPSMPSIPDPVQPIIVTNHTYESFGSNRIDLGETVAIVGGLGLAMIFLMGFILLTDEFRGRRFGS